MPRKKTDAAAADDAAADGETTTTEPRRSSRIKDQPKPAPVEKKPAKPRAKKPKAEGDAAAADGEAPKKGGKKRKADEANGTAEGEKEEAKKEEEEEPAAKKVCRFNACWLITPVLTARFARSVGVWFYRLRQDQSHLLKLLQSLHPKLPSHPRKLRSLRPRLSLPHELGRRSR
jgi:hypothetical protein